MASARGYRRGVGGTRYEDGGRSCVDEAPSDEELTVRAQCGDSAALGLLLAGELR
jgi:hypothetical protein